MKLLLSILCFAALAFGEKINVIDDSLFQPKKEAAKPPANNTSKGVITGTERYINEDLEFREINEGQQRKFLETCESKKSDPRDYSKCVRSERVKATKGVQEQREGIELGGTGSKLPFVEDNRKPADGESDDF